MNVLLTGATGFIGKRLLERLSQNQSVALALRSAKTDFQCPVFLTGEMDAHTDWSHALIGQQVVIHAAARAHIMEDEVAASLAEYRRVNVGGTMNLARQAAAANVKRFIFISSIKVNGEQTPLGQPFTADDTPEPLDAYGMSKSEAEQGLQQLASDTAMDVVIIRPPLVYGPWVKGNFASMCRLVGTGLPLPLGAINNLRSLVAVDNLVDLIMTCIDHPAAANQVFLAGDGHDLSTTGLFRGVAEALGKPSRLIPVPSCLLMLCATLIGKKATAQRLLSSLQVDISKARDLLGWSPPVTVEEGLRRCFESQDKY